MKGKIWCVRGLLKCDVKFWSRKELQLYGVKLELRVMNKLDVRFYI